MIDKTHSESIEAGLLQMLARQFCSIVGEAGVLTSEAECRPFECDGLAAYKQPPPMVVLPTTTAQVQQIVTLCHKHQVAIVPRGSGTGLSGGALPRKNAITLGLNRMNTIIDIDADNRTMRVQPGIANSTVSAAVAHLGLFFAPDPSSQIVSSIGGNIAENAGGVHCLKYGLTRDNVTGVTLVMADGSLLTVGGDVFDEPGLDILSVIAGSEGLLGIVVEAVLRLVPLPHCTKLLMAGFPSVVTAARTVSSIIAKGLLPASLEMMDKPIIELVEARYQLGYPNDCAALLLCELDGSEAEVASDLGKLMIIVIEGGSNTQRIAEDENERQRLWKGRKSAFPAVASVAPDYYCMDGTVPRKYLAEVLERIYQLSGEYGYPVFNVFHAGDGNLHPLILYDSSQAGALQQVEALGKAILDECITHNGTITGEHGVGVEKLDSMCAQFSNAELEQFHRLRQAFDPLTILNPGKAIPTLNRCAELGAMHVHQGKLPMPHIERF